MRLRIIFFVVLSLNYYTQLFAGLQSPGPFAGDVNVLTSTFGDVTLAASKNGIYRSEDNSSWELVSLGNNNVHVTCFLNLSSNSIYAGTTKGMYASADTGRTWKLVPASSSLGAITSLIKISSKSIFAGTQDGQVFHSSDGAKHWFSISLEKGLGAIVDLASDSSGGMYAGTEKGFILSSTDGGIKWSKGSAPFKKFPLSSLIVTTDGKIIISSHGEGIVKWDNSLQKGTNISKDFPFLNINKLYLGEKNSIIALIDIGGFVKSDDYGEHWTTLGMTKHHLHAMSLDSKGQILIGSDRGVFKYIGEKKWEQVGVPSMSISVLSKVNSNVLLAGTKEAGVFTSTDNGTSWTQTSKGISGKSISCISQISDSVIAIGVLPEFPAHTVGGLHISVDTGRTWTQTRLLSVTVSSIISVGNTIFAATDSGLYFSKDMGQSWAKSNSELGGMKLQTLSKDSHNILFATSGSKCFASADSGTTWNHNKRFPPMKPFQMISSNESVIALSSKKIYASSDGGESWKELKNPARKTELNHFEITESGDYYCSSLNELYRSSDKGATWKLLPFKISPISFNTFTIINNTIPVLGSEHLSVIVLHY